MAGDNHVDVEAQKSIAGFDPIVYRTCPCDRSPFDEQNIAGVDDSIRRDKGDHIARSMRRPDLDQHTCLSPTLSVSSPVKVLSGNLNVTPAKSNAPKIFLKNAPTS